MSNTQMAEAMNNAEAAKPTQSASDKRAARVAAATQAATMNKAAQTETAATQAATMNKAAQTETAATQAATMMTLSNSQTVELAALGATLGQADGARYDAIVATGRYIATLYFVGEKEALPLIVAAREAIKEAFMQARFARLMAGKRVGVGSAEGAADKLMEAVNAVAFIAYKAPERLDDLPQSEHGLCEMAANIRNPNRKAELEAIKLAKLHETKAGDTTSPIPLGLPDTSNKPGAHGDGENPLTPQAFRVAHDTLYAHLAHLGAVKFNLPNADAVKLNAVLALLKIASGD